MSHRRDFQEDKSWEEAWLPHVMNCVKAKWLLRQAEERQDMQEVSDLAVVKSGDVRIGVRIRHPEYFDRYAHEMTLRGARPSGVKHEVEKILDGWGDLFFYGFANPGWRHVKCLRRWTLVSLHAFRRIVDAHGMKSLGAPIPNADGSSVFYAVQIEAMARLDRKFIIDRNWD